LPAAEPGPAYAAVYGRGIARLEPDGWKLVKEKYAAVALNGDALWAVGKDQVWRYDGTTFVELPAPGPMTGYEVAYDGSLWAISGGKLLHVVDDGWVPETLPGADPPRGVAAMRDGLWVSTLDRTYRKRGDAWTAIDVPNVTGTERDILALDARGDDVYLATSTAVLRFTGSAWTPVALGRPLELSTSAFVVAGPGGRFAVGDYETKLIYTPRGLAPLDVSGMQLNPSLLWITAIDDRGRVWAGIDGGGAVVFDETGKRLKYWSAAEAPVLEPRPFQVVVGRGGPAHLDAGERATVTITGKLEGSAGGVEIVACGQNDIYGPMNPCDDLPKQATKTAAGGTFTLHGVPLVPTYFWVKRGGRWRKTLTAACCDKLAPDTTVDLGTLILQ
jgi:hypothetical protein